MNIRYTSCRWVLCYAVTTAALIACRSVSHAAVTPYSNLASWTTAAGSPIVVEDFADTALAPGLTIAFGQNSPGGQISSGTYSDTALTQFNDARNPKLNFAGGTFAFGADWDFSPGGAGDGLVLVLALANSTTTTLSIGNPGGGVFNGFFGFVSDVAVTSIRLDSPGTGLEAFSMDNARFRGAVCGPINFDDAADGTVINTRYSCVTFTNPIGGNIYARNGSGFAPSPPNQVSVFATGLPDFDARWGAVDGRFATPVGTVSIDARPLAPPEFLTPLTKRPFLQAFDAADRLLGTVYYAGPLPTTGGAIGPTETLTFSSTANNIARVRFSSQNPGNPPTVPPTYGLFDNLQFTAVYTLSANVVGSGTVSASPSQATYAAGTVVNLTATASPNWIFSAWSGDASGTANPLQLSMNGNKTVTATFVPVPPPTSTPEATFCADFNSAVPSGMTLFGQAAVSGGYLKLTEALNGQFGIAYINDFNGGAPVSAFTATFKAALFGAAYPDYPADGFSFNLVPAATVLANPGLGQPAEEGLSEGLAVNFDTWDNGGGEAPAIEVKWLGQIIAATPFQASQSPAGITDPAVASRDVIINLETDGTLDVSYGGVVVLNNVQTPYRSTVIGAPKWVIGARTGLANDNHWIDDLCIHTLAGGKLCNGFENGVPTGMTLFGGATVDAGRLKLYTIPQTNGFGIAYLDDFSGGQFVKAFRATFSAALFGSTCCGGGAYPADGFSFNLVPAASVLPNPAYNEPAEEGLEQGLAVNFDTWDNGADEVGPVAPAIEVKWLGQVIAAVPFQASQSPAGITDPAAAAREVVIELKADGKLDVSYGGTLVLNNVATPYDPAAIRTPKWVLGSRIGLANDNYWFDNLCISTLPAPGHQIPGLFNTGVDDQGVPLPDNAVDPHYRLVPGGTDAYAATVDGGFPIPPWLGSNSLSGWISPALDTQAASDGSGTFNYRYETTFDLTGFNPATARLAGRWATDNQGVDILINGVSIGQVNTNQFAAWTPFQITSGFVAGTNRLTFVVNNGGPGSLPGIDPTGLRAEVWGAASLDAAFRPAPPRLGLGRQNGNLVITWPEPGFVLQSAPSVAGPWHDITRGASQNGQDYTATLPLSGPAQFLRLRLDNE